jgi:tripartite-type tricarboxylate transporter receptor subunit TctC
VTSVKSVKELIDLIKSKPGELAYASPGVGSANHIAAVMFTSATKTSMVHVPYRGSAPAITDLLGGQVTMNFDAMTSVANYVKEGRMRALAVTTKERNPQLPDVPTMQEQGIKDFDVTIWYSLMGPAGLPKATVALLNDKLNGVLRRPDVKKQLAELGVTVQPLSPDQVTGLLRADIAKYSSVVKQNNIRMD